MRQPRTNSGKDLLKLAHLHDKNCFVHQGMDCGRCALPGMLRDVEDEAIAPFVDFTAFVESSTKPTSISMGGETHGHLVSPIRAKDLWLRANNLLNEEAEGSEGLCMCGSAPGQHEPENIRYCHFGYHTLSCVVAHVKGGDHV